MAISSASAVISDCDGVPGQQTHCTQCKERLRGKHSHPGQWKSELQQFLLKYSEIPGSLCVCKACELSIQQGLHGKYEAEYIPRWIKRNIKKEKQCCCVPGCDKTSERSCVFADFDTICEAANVSVSEEEVSSPLHLCSEHYYATHSYCRCVSECALCGSKSKHRAGNDKGAPLRHLPQPETIKVLLHKAGNLRNV